MNRETLIDLRNIFIACFFIGFIFMAGATLLYMPYECVLAKFYLVNVGMNLDTYIILWTSFIGFIRIIMLFAFLIPALAMHVTLMIKDKNKKA